MKSEEIKKYMKAMGWTQKVLAQKAGIHPITLNRNLKQNKFSDKTLRKLLNAFNLNGYYPNLTPNAPSIMKISGHIELVGESVEIKNDQDIEEIFKDILKIKKISSSLSLKITNNYVFFHHRDFHRPYLYSLFSSFFKSYPWHQEITEREFFKELKNFFNSDLVFRQVILNPIFYGKIFFYEYYDRKTCYYKENKVGKLFTKLRDEELEKLNK